MPGALPNAAIAVAIAFAIAACSPTPTPSPTGAGPIASPPAPSDTAPPPTPEATPTAGATSPPPATTDVGIDGIAVTSGAAALPIAVMIDDNVVARPQSGFNGASVVYQAPADGGEDRYMLVFQGRDAPEVGPVRSGRPYFVYWAAEYRAGFAHFGGDEKTRLQVIPSIAGRLMYNLDALDGSGSAFHRIRERAAPHNAYTSWSALRATASRRGYPDAMPGGLGAYVFRDDAPLADRPSSASMSIPYGRGASSYVYDRASDSYLRSVAGKPHVDAGDGKRVTARNVIVLFMALSIDPESEPGYHRPVLRQIGSGKAIVFREGKAIEATWRKADAGALTRLYDSAGKEIELVRGRIFFQVVPSGTKVTYKAG